MFFILNFPSAKVEKESWAKRRKSVFGTTRTALRDELTIHWDEWAKYITKNEAFPFGLASSFLFELPT